MKKLVGVDIGSYSFDASARTITFSNCGSLTLDNVLLITNVSDHIIIYNFADTNTTGTIVGNVLTLVYDTSVMSDSDNLQIYIDVAVSDPATETTQERLADVIEILLRLFKMLESSGVTDSSQRQRIIVDAIVGSTLGVAVVGNAIQAAAPLGPITSSQYLQGIFEGPVDQRWRIIDQARTAFAVGIQKEIVFT